MNKPTEHIFATRPTAILELPLKKHVRILYPERVILKIGAAYHDLGAFCYSARSHQKRKGQPRGVVIGSFLKQRPSQILQLIKALSSLITDGGLRIATAKTYATYFKFFLDWADFNGFHDCLAGGDASRRAYFAWVEKTGECYRREEFGEISYNNRIGLIGKLLQSAAGLGELTRGIRKLKRRGNPSGGTAPLSSHDFAHAVALNQALFDGLCDLVLERRPFPYKLVLPTTLGWAENHLWLFPTIMWRLPPHKWGLEREKLTYPHWPYDYAEGRLAAPDEIAHRYAGTLLRKQLMTAKLTIAQATARINDANGDERDWVRMMLGMIAHNAFLFLFFCHTGANESVAREIETDGEITPATLNQKYRSIKFRADGKLMTLVVPVTFMPALRRFMVLHQYLLHDNAFPHLFFTLGQRRNKQRRPSQIGSGALESLYTNLLRIIDPQLPRIASRKLRASVADWYQRHHDASVTAKVLQNSERTAQINYDAGSVTDHHEELSLFLSSVSESAKRQRVIPIRAAVGNRPLEEGGDCDGFGHPEALADYVPVKPNCKDSQGCLFCTHRVLVACEEDARKVASAAFVMEQVILGPKHEEVLRPLIGKCEQDLEKIATFDNCRSMVEHVRNDVFERGNLTPFFTDKYQLFLELGVIV
jgi:hypothetical protein